MLTERIIKNWLTTIVGLAFLCIAGMLFYTGKITSGELITFVPFCLSLIWSKNTLITDLFKGNTIKLIVVAICIGMLTSCITQRRCNEKYPPETSQKDSVYNTHYESIRDTAIPVAPDSSMIKMLVRCDSLGQAYLSQLISYQAGNNISIPKVTLSHNILTANCKIDSMAVYAKLKDKYGLEVRYKERTIIQKVNELTPFQKFAIKAFWVYTCLLIITILLFVIKFILK